MCCPLTRSLTAGFLAVLVVVCVTPLLGARKAPARRAPQRRPAPVVKAEPEPPAPRWPGTGEHSLPALFANNFTFIKVPPMKGEMMDIAVQGDICYVLVQNFNLITDAIVRIGRGSGRIHSIWGVGQRDAVALTAEGGSLWIMSRSPRYFLRRIDRQGRAMEYLSVNELPAGELSGLAILNGEFYVAAAREGESIVLRYSRRERRLVKIAAYPGHLYSLAAHRGRLVAFQANADTYADRWLILIDPAGGTPQKIHYINSIARGLDADGDSLYAMQRKEYGAWIYPVAYTADRRVLCANPVMRRVEITYPISNHNANPAAVDTWLACPVEDAYQHVRDLRITPEPRTIVTDRYGNRWAHVRWDRITESTRAVMSFDVLSCGIAVTLDGAYQFQAQDLPADLLKSYPETHCVDATSYVIKSHASRIVPAGSYLNRIFSVRQYVTEAVSRTGDGDWLQASTYLFKGRGNDYGQSVAFNALMRHFGYPARSIGGFMLDEGAPAGRRNVATWNQVYVPPVGWVDIDIYRDRNREGRTTNRRIGYRPPGTIVTFQGDYDEMNYESILAERCWWQAARWSSLDRAWPAAITFGPAAVNQRIITQ